MEPSIATGYDGLVPRKPGDVLKTLALLLVSAIASVLCLEAATRAYRFGPSALVPSIMESIRPVENSGLVRASPYIEIRYEYRPNLDTRFKKVAFRTNSHGFRDREYAVEKPPGTYRVAVIGDSMTVPEGVEIEDAFHSLVEDRLTRESRDRRFEFLNFAVGGYALPQYLGTIRHRALAWTPDMILVGFCVNDYFWDEAYAAAHFNTRYVVPPVIHSFFHWHVLDWIAEAREARAFRPANADAGGMPPEWQLPTQYRDWMARELAEFATVSRDAKTPIVFAFVTSQSRGYASLIDAVRTITTENRMYFVDLSQGFPPAADPERFFIYRADGHANAAAHRIFADALYSFLEGGTVPGFPASR